MSGYHPRALERAQQHLDRALAAIGDADRTLAEAGVREADRGAVADAQLPLFELHGWIAGELRSAVRELPEPLLELPDDAPPPPAADAPGARPPSLDEAVEMLFGPSRQADLETEFGQLVTLELCDRRDTLLTAVAPRLTVRPGMLLTGRIIDPDRVPWRIALSCRASLEHEASATVELELTEVAGDNQRGTGRLGIDATVTLTALDCAELQAGEELLAQVVDLSQSGIAVSSDNPRLCRGDRLSLRLRLLSGTVEAEVRVASVRAASSGAVYGCWFTVISAQSQAVVDRLLERRAPRPAVSGDWLRQLVAGQHDRVAGRSA